MSEPTPDLYAEVLLCPMGDNGADAGTVGEYLQVLLETLWIQTDTFSGKRPFGTGSWPYELYEALIVGGFVQGVFDEDGYLDEFTEDEMEKADDLIIQAIDYAFRPWRTEIEAVEEDEDVEEEVEGEDLEDEDAEFEEELEEHATNNGFAARETITMVELTEEPVLLLADEEENEYEGTVQIVGFVEAPEDDDDFYVEDESVEDVVAAFEAGAQEITAPPTGIRSTNDSEFSDSVIASEESPSLPTTEDQEPEDSPAPESQLQTPLMQSTPLPVAGEAE